MNLLHLGGGRTSGADLSRDPRLFYRGIYVLIFDYSKLVLQSSLRVVENNLNILLDALRNSGFFSLIEDQNNVGKARWHIPAAL